MPWEAYNIFAGMLYIVQPYHVLRDTQRRGFTQACYNLA